MNKLKCLSFQWGYYILLLDSNNFDSNIRIRNCLNNLNYAKKIKTLYPKIDSESDDIKLASFHKV